jgi:hypothetical protein
VKGRPESGPEAVEGLFATRQALVDVHVRNNDRSAGLWDLYSDHRRRLTELVLDGDPRGSLGVLGAGNANDLDLTTLTDGFQEVHLADLDGAALIRAVRRQTLATRRRLVLHPARDLSGLLDRLPLWRAHAPDAEALARVVPAAAARVVAQLPEAFDVVLSDCFLSQLAWTCYQALGDGPLLMDVLAVAMAAHLRTLVALTRPGGRCLLVTDVASCDQSSFEGSPFERSRAFDDEALLRDLEERGELFSGTSPALARLMLTQDPQLARDVEDATLMAPWSWRISQRRTVLVYAIAFRRRVARLGNDQDVRVVISPRGS